MTGDPGEPSPPRRARLGCAAIGLVVLTAALGGVVFAVRARTSQSQGGARSGGAPNGPIPVHTGHPSRTDVEIRLGAVGTIVATQTAVVRPRIDGVLESIRFTEGAEVHAGDLLATLDARPLRAAAREAEGVVARDVALLEQATTVRDRTVQLHEHGLAATQELDAAASEVRRLAAQVSADRALLDTARLSVSFTRIEAPIDGIVGLRNLDVGNSLSAADANGLCVITAIDPIAVRFSLPQDDLAVLRTRMREGVVPVDVLGRDDDAALASGHLTVIDNRIDETTGTLRLKAELPNADQRLWPNQLVSVRVHVETRRDALVVPDAAVQQGPEGPFVYVVGQEGVATVRRVVVERTVGELALVSGLETTDEIVLDGQSRLRPGAAVERVAEGASSRPTSGPPSGATPTP